MTNIVALAECCEFIRDGTHGSPLRQPTGFPVLSAAHVRGGRLWFDTDRFTTQQELEAFQKRLKPAPGDVLLTIVGTIGRTAIVTKDRPLVFQRSVCVLRPKTKLIMSAYLKFALESQSVKAQFNVEKHEVAQAGIYLEALNEIKIPLPSIPEQERITQLLNRADRLCHSRRYVRETSGTFLQSAFLKMFGDPVKNPMCWEMCTLEELGELDRGRSKHRPRNAPELLGGPYPLIQTGEVANSDGYIRGYKQTYSEIGLKQSKIWPKGTLCITIAANIAKTGIILFDACFPDSVVGFTPNSKTNTEYVQQWFSFVQQYIERIAPASAQKNINLEILRGLQIPLPPIKLQGQFASVVRMIERLRIQQREADRQTEHLFQTLLHCGFLQNHKT